MKILAVFKAKFDQLDFYESSLYLITCIAMLVILIFIPLRWVNGDITQLKFNIFILFMMIGINWCLMNDKSKLAKSLYLGGVFAYIIISTFISGASHIFWYYPITTLIFFILTPKNALMVTTLFITVIGIIIFNELTLIEWIKIILSSQINIFITYIFCSKANQHMSTLGTEARIDELSGLANRRSFNKALEKLRVSSSSNTETNYLMLLDIDNFKSINDTYGHIVGDNVIKHFSDIIQRSLSPNSSAFRLGGDEFAIIFQSTEATQAMILAEKMRQQMKGNVYINTLDNSDISYTTSIGLAAHEPDTQKWYRNADKALYRAKRDGKDKASFFEA